MLSQTTEYALRAVMHLSTLPREQAATSQVIADHTQVPKGYLSKVLRDLVVAGVVTSVRGPSGGFILARPPEAITILDVVNAVDPIKRIDKCPLGNPAHVNLCPLHRRLDQAIASVERGFRETTLDDLREPAALPGSQCTRLGRS